MFLLCYMSFWDLGKQCGFQLVECQNCHTLEELGHGTAMGITTKYFFVGGILDNSSVATECIRCAFMPSYVVSCIVAACKILVVLSGLCICGDHLSCILLEAYSAFAFPWEAFSISSPCVPALLSCGGIFENPFLNFGANAFDHTFNEAWRTRRKTRWWVLVPMPWKTSSTRLEERVAKRFRRVWCKCLGKCGEGGFENASQNAFVEFGANALENAFNEGWRMRQKTRSCCVVPMPWKTRSMSLQERVAKRVH